LTSLGILALTHSAIFNAQFWLLWVLTLPAVLLGSLAGVALYRRITEVNFRRAVLILLIVSRCQPVGEGVDVSGRLAVDYRRLHDPELVKSEA
jgi:hypothetical protein